MVGLSVADNVITPLLPILPNVLEISTLVNAERAKLRAEKRLKKPRSAFG